MSPHKPSDSYYSLKKKFISDLKSKAAKEAYSGYSSIHTTNSKSVKKTSRGGERKSGSSKVSPVSKNYMKSIASKAVSAKEVEPVEVNLKPKIINQETIDKANLLYLREMRRLQETEHKRQAARENRTAKELGNCSFKPETLANNSFRDNAE